MSESKQQQQWWVPLMGALFVVVLVIGFFMQGDTPTPPDDSAAKIASYYADHKDKLEIAAFVQALSLVLLVVFFAHLRQLMRDAVGERSVLPTMAIAGATIFAAGSAFDAALLVATADTAGDISNSGSETLVALYNNDFVPFIVGVVLFQLGVGIATLRTGMLPKWIGALSLLFVVVAFTPIGFVAFIGTGPWLLVVSILLTVRARRTPATA